ncbi:peptidase M16 [Bryobacterales bacterium F-183]|nr:peptidase M16 [Bryobacterales bacterium F-183]
MSQKLFPAVALAFALSAGLATAQSAASPLKKITSVEGITEYQLDNGLKVLLIPDPSNPKVTVNITYFVGSKHENYGETGMAHLLEHMVFKGTPTTKDVWKALQDHGAQFNGTTWLDRTNYFETMAATDENLEFAIKLEADRMVNSFIAKKDLDSEMTVVRNEFEMGENSPFRVLMQRSMSVAFEWHNYGKTTIGARSDIENVPIERLQAFYRKYYQPDNALLVVAGKFDEAKALKLIADNFGKIPRPERKLEKLYTQEPTQDGDRQVNVRRVGDVQLITMIYHVPAGTHEDFAPVQILAQILGDSPGGRLYKALVDNKKAASVGNMEFQNAEPGVSMFTAQLTKDQSLDEARKEMLKVIEGISKEPPSKEEVERARAKMLKDVDLVMSKSDQIGVALSDYAAMGDWRMLFIDRDRIKNAKVEDVQRVAKLYFKESNRTVGQFIPTENPDRAEIPKTPDVTAILKDYKGAAEMAKGEVFDPSPTNIESRTKRVTLPNGMKLVMLSKQNRGETVRAALTLRMGTEKTLTGKGAISSTTASMLMRGTTKRTRQQIDDELSRLQARMNVGGAGPGVSASVETTRKNLPEALKLMAEVLREPAFPDSELEQIRSRAIAQYDAARREPNQIAITNLQRHLYPMPAGHPREVKTPEQMSEDMKAVKLDELKAFYKDFYGASNADLVLVGDFDPKEMEALAKQLFGDWKSPQPYVRMTRTFEKITPDNKAFETPDKANAMFAAGLRFRMSDEDPDYPALVIANYILGGSASSRLLDRLRQKEGYSYGAQSQMSAGSREDDGMFMAFAILAPQNMVKLEAAFKEELVKALKDGFTPAEVESAKKSYLQERVIMRSQDGALVSILGANEFHGRTMAFQQNMEKKIEALTLHDVNTVLRKVLSPENLTIYKAGDFKKAGVTP